MTRLSDQTKHITLELHVNADRSPYELVTTIAEVLHIEAGEQQGLEYIKLAHVKHINKEATNATQPMEH